MVFLTAFILLCQASWPSLTLLSLAQESSAGPEVSLIFFCFSSSGFCPIGLYQMMPLPNSPYGRRLFLYFICHVSYVISFGTMPCPLGRRGIPSWGLSKIPVCVSANTQSYRPGLLGRQGQAHSRKAEQKSLCFFGNRVVYLTPQTLPRLTLGRNLRNNPEYGDNR